MSEEQRTGITKIAVKGFKSIAEECAIDICPLTVLAGANSSGKSSIMQPLLMLKQTLNAPYDPGPLKIDGPNVQFTLADQFFSKLTTEKRVDRFHIQIETDRSNLVRTTFRKGSGGIEIGEMTRGTLEGDQTSPPKHFTLYPEMPPEEIKLLDDEDSVFEDFDVVKRSGCFLYLESEGGDKHLNFTHDAAFNIVNSVYLPGLRGNPAPFYNLTSTGPWYPGRFEHYAASIIHEWQETKNERLKTLGDALHVLGLTGKVSTQKVGDVGIEVQVGRLPHDRTGGTDMVNIADVGIGISQVLPVIVALTAAEQGQLVYIEQPELHLHPRAQVALAQVLADAAKRGVRVVVETHSSLLLLGIQTLVAEGDLSPELVKFHWFSRSKDGVTAVNSVDLDNAGAYGDWPIDFADVSLHAQSGYIKAARSRFIKGT